MKGMLTGPVTILNWSWPREDITHEQQTQQLALAIRDEVLDLEKAGIKVTQVVVGSCTNGRLNDMEQVAKAFKGKKVSPDVNVLIVPASREILGQMEERGWTKIIRDAGATILNPGCGSCFGAHEGLITPRDVCVSTTNRNFPGRMGSKVGQIYLASPATAAATALTGVITVPEV